MYSSVICHLGRPCKNDIFLSQFNLLDSVYADELCVDPVSNNIVRGQHFIYAVNL